MSDLKNKSFEQLIALLKTKKGTQELRQLFSEEKDSKINRTLSLYMAASMAMAPPTSSLAADASTLSTKQQPYF